MRKSKKQEILLSALKEIEKKKGYVTPKDFVDYSRPESSLTHKYFKWDDEKAAEKYRLWQARQLIAEVRVEYLGRVTDAYYNVTTIINSVPQQGYFSVAKVLSSDELYRKVLVEAIKELQYWQNKYKKISELKEVVNEKQLTKAKKKIGLI